MGLHGIKESNEYHKEHPNPQGRQMICPRCKGGNGASEVAKKKKLKPIKDVPCFTCYCILKDQAAIPIRQTQKVAKLSPSVATMLKTIPRHKRKGRTATIRRGK